MGSFGCILWWCLLGGLLGWLASWLFGRRKPVVVEKIVDRPVDRIVEKIVDRPVDKIVEKVVEKPVDRIIEKFVDNPVHLSRISALEGEVGLLAGLRQTIARLESTPPKIVEKIIDRPVDRIVERVVEKTVDRPVDRIVEKIVDRPVDRIVEKIVDRPVERIVEKIVDRPVDRIVEKIVDNPAHLARVKTLEMEVALIAGLRSTISRLESTPPKIVEKIVDRPVEKIVEKIIDRPVDRIVEKVVEKIVDRPVDRIVEKIVDRPVTTIVEKIVDRPVERIVEKIIDRPVDRIVEKIVEKIVDRPVDRIVEKLVDNPVHLGRIKTLEAEVSTIAGFRQTIARLEATPPKIVEKIIDRPVDRIVEKVVEKIIDRPVDRIVEKIVDRPVDRIVEKQVDNPEHLRRIKALEAELEGFKSKTVVLDKAAAKAAGFSVRGMDDLEVIEGIGPKIAGLFHDAGIHMFWELAETPTARMQAILDAAGPNYKLANPSTWATQSNLAARNRWAELRKLQDELNAGVRK